MTIAAVGEVVAEKLVGERVGRTITADAQHVAQDVLVGERVGRTIAADAQHVTVDVLIKVSPVYIGHMHVETLVDLPNDPTRPGVRAWRFAEEIAQQRDQMPHPSIVWSWTECRTYSQVIATGRTPPPWARSPIDAATSVELAAIARNTVVLRSPIAANSLRSMAVMSRGQVYIPSSGVSTASIALLVPTERPGLIAPGATLSPTNAGSVVQLLVMSKVAKEPDPTNISVASECAQVLIARSAPWPVDDQVAHVSAMAVALRVPVLAHGPDDVANVQQVITTDRITTTPHGPDDVAQVVQMIVLERPGGPPHGPQGVAQLSGWVLQRRLTQNPADVGGWYLGHGAQLVAAIRDVLLPNTVTAMQVGLARITYTMGRTVKRPIDVIDPSIGRHAANLHQLMTMWRPTDTPDEKMRKQRLLIGLAQHVAMRDATFKPPPTEHEDGDGEVFQVMQHLVLPDNEWEWLPTSAANVRALVQQVAVDDTEWGDPTTPGSDVEVATLFSGAVLPDTEWGDPTTPASDVHVLQVIEQPALADSEFPPSNIPQAVLTVGSALSFAVVGDEGFPDSTTSQSAVDLLAVASVTVSRDNSLIGRLPVSNNELLTVLSVAVVPDPTLNGIPKRPRGPRPVIGIVRR